MCGAVNVKDELKGSFQDVNETVRQIFTTVRRFGPDEKHALRETFRDAQYFMRKKVRSALLRKGDDDSSMGSPKRRGGRGGRSELSEKRSTVNEVRRRNMMRTPVAESERETQVDVFDESEGGSGAWTTSHPDDVVSLDENRRAQECVVVIMLCRQVQVYRKGMKSRNICYVFDWGLWRMVRKIIHQKELYACACATYV